MNNIHIYNFFKIFTTKNIKIIKFLLKIFLLLIILMHQKANANPIVFAHYMVCCPTYGQKINIDQAKQEIIMAKNVGINGFALNIGDWNQLYKNNVEKLYEASEIVGDFYLFISFDGKSFNFFDEIINSTSKYSSNFKINEKILISSFGTGGLKNEAILKIYEKYNRKYFFVMHIFPKSNNPELPSQDEVKEMIESYKYLDGFFYFGAAGKYEEISKSIINYSKAISGKKYFIAGVSPFYSGTGSNNRFFDGNGFVGIKKQWDAAIKSNANMIEIITWNDWNENTYIAPTGLMLNKKSLWSNHFGIKYNHDGFYFYVKRLIEIFSANNKDSTFFYYSYIGLNEGVCSKDQFGDTISQGLNFIYNINEKCELIITDPEGLEKIFLLPLGYNDFSVKIDHQINPKISILCNKKNIGEINENIAIDKNGTSCQKNYHSGVIFDH